jgi:hypothetical protein
VAAAFAFSFKLFLSAVGLTSPWLSLMLMADFLGLIAFGRPLFQLRMPEFLRKVRNWETNGGVYQALRVPAFGALLRRTPLRHLNPVVYLIPGSDPLAVQAQIESAEAAHFIAAVLLVPYMAYALLQGWWGSVTCFVIGQIGFRTERLQGAHARLVQEPDASPRNQRI